MINVIEKRKIAKEGRGRKTGRVEGKTLGTKTQ